MLSEFRSFLVKQNALALAIGVIIGTALGKVVDSLVGDIIMPPVGKALGGVDFAASPSTSVAAWSSAKACS
jgi:large conductance mechanosensitive channel